MGGRWEVRITGDDVGKRVSVRTLTDSADPTARYTDTVGLLTSWTDGVLKITRRDGRVAELPETSVVAGKVVPPTPARRRGVPAAGTPELVRVAARGWPALETARLGDWLLRASPLPAPDAVGTDRAGGGTPDGPEPRREGFTARANSVLPLGEPGVDLDEALRRLIRWYDDRGLPARIQVTTGRPDGDHALDGELDRRGWRTEKHAVVRVAALAPLADRAPDSRVRLHRAPDEQWLRAYGRVTGDTCGTAVRVLRGGPSVTFATVPEEDGPGDRPAAIGRLVVDGRWAGFTAMEVAPGHRRRGLASTVLAELARAALAEGASAAYLQVETDNAPALAFYTRHGFEDHHAYHYRLPPLR